MMTTVRIQIADAVSSSVSVAKRAQKFNLEVTTPNKSKRVGRHEYVYSLDAGGDEKVPPQHTANPKGAMPFIA